MRSAVSGACRDNPIAVTPPCSRSRSECSRDYCTRTKTTRGFLYQQVRSRPRRRSSGREPDLRHGTAEASGTAAAAAVRGRAALITAGTLVPFPPFPPFPLPGKLYAALDGTGGP